MANSYRYSFGADYRFDEVKGLLMAVQIPFIANVLCSDRIANFSTFFIFLLGIGSDHQGQANPSTGTQGLAGHFNSQR